LVFNGIFNTDINDNNSLTHFTILSAIWAHQRP
jgi:hypothetical protein